MELEVKKGYLVYKFNYDIFDEIIYFLTNEGEILNCFSNGSRKINSKNGRNLFYGNFIEIEFFRKNSNKLNKLKKAVSIKSLDSSINNNKSLLNINIIFTKFRINKNKNLYILYQETLALIMLDKDIKNIFNYFFVKFLILLNPNLEKLSCDKCNSLNICSLSIEKKCFFCNLCFNDEDLFLFDFEMILLMKFVNNKSFLEIEKNDFIANDNIYKKITKKLIKYKEY